MSLKFTTTNDEGVETKGELLVDDAPVTEENPLPVPPLVIGEEEAAAIGEAIGENTPKLAAATDAVGIYAYILQEGQLAPAKLQAEQATGALKVYNAGLDSLGAKTDNPVALTADIGSGVSLSIPAILKSIFNAVRGLAAWATGGFKVDTTGTPCVAVHTVVTWTSGTLNTSLTLLAADANGNRLGYNIITDAAYNVFLSQDGAAATLSNGIRINANGSNYFLDVKSPMWSRQAVKAICANSGGRVLVTEYIKAT